MCGIAGFFASEPIRNAPAVIEAWNRQLSHRGPDDFGHLTWTKGQIPLFSKNSPEGAIQLCFHHRRLSILDLSELGRQPMMTANGRFAMTYNGEIYNYLELKEELRKLGRSFRTNSDTEVFLEGFAQWGPELFSKCVGMFAAAILDTHENKLILVRDFFGIKPLHYFKSNSKIVFSSELKPILEFPGVSRKVHGQTAFEYLRFNMTDSGETTFFSDISQVPQGSYLSVDLSNLKSELHTYWRPTVSTNLNLSFDDSAKQLRNLFEESVGLHLRSDVPVGVCLSGGIDSTSILQTIRHLNPRAQILGISFVPDNGENSEEKWIDLAAKSANAKVTKVTPHSEELISDLDELIRVQEIPFGSTSMYAQYRVFKEAKEQGLKVMLDGQGADEIFGGYFSYTSARLASLLKQGKLLEAARQLRAFSNLPGASGLGLLSQGLGLLVPPGLQGPLRTVAGRTLNPKWMKANWFEEQGVQMTSAWTGRTQNVLKDQLHETLVRLSLPMLLRYEDRNSMAFSVESRVPFLTPKLVDFAFGLPEEYVISPQGETKSVFRKAMRGLVPDGILDRRDKIGFATPEAKWLMKAESWIDQTLKSPAAKAIPLFNHDQILLEWNRMRAGKQKLDPRLWRWVNMIKWAQNFDVRF